MTGWPVERVIASVTAVPAGKTEADRRRFDLVAPPHEVSGGRTWLTTKHSTSREYKRATTTVVTASIEPVPRAFAGMAGPRWVDGAPRCPECGRLLAEQDGFWSHARGERRGCLWTD